MCCKQGLPRPDKSGLAMTEGWIPIFMGMTDKMGTIHRAPTLGKMRKGIDSHFHGNDIWGNGNDREDKTGFFISV